MLKLPLLDSWIVSHNPAANQHAVLCQHVTPCPGKQNRNIPSTSSHLPSFGICQTSIRQDDDKVSASVGRHRQLPYPAVPPYLSMRRLTDGLPVAKLRVRTLTGKEIELDIEPDYKVSLIRRWARLFRKLLREKMTQKMYRVRRIDRPEGIRWICRPERKPDSDMRQRLD